MTRIKVKCPNAKDKAKKLKLVEILSRNDADITKVFDATDGFAVLLLNDDHTDHLFAAEVKNELQANGFSPIMPPKLRAKRSAIISRVDELIYCRNQEEMTDELISHNTWIGDEIENVFKFPNSNTINISFKQTSVAK